MSQGFVRTFGYEPEGTWTAPGRVNIIGEFTDYNDGFVLPTPLSLATSASLGRRNDEIVRVASRERAPESDRPLSQAHLDDVRPGAPDGWAAYAIAIPWTLRDLGHRVGGADIYIESDVPIGAGLSSSAALECSIALAYRELFDLDLDVDDLALIARRAENEFVGVPCGILDQMAVLTCVPGHALLLDTRSLERRQVPFTPTDAGLSLMVIDSGVSHDLANSGYADRRYACEVAAGEIGVRALRDVEIERLDDALARVAAPELRRRVRHVVTENARVLEVAQLLESGRIAEIGPILTAGHRSLRDDFEVSCPEIEVAVDAALEAGALGARMIGGGFGGSVLALVRSSSVDDVGRAVTDAFEAAGYGAPCVLPVIG